MSNIANIGFEEIAKNFFKCVPGGKMGAGCIVLILIMSGLVLHGFKVIRKRMIERNNRWLRDGVTEED